MKIIKITTPKKVLLNGIIFGPEKPKNIFIFIHGLASNLFFNIDLYEKLCNKDTAVLAFNNRGTGIISGVKKMTTKNKKGFEYVDAGMAHEIFTDCYDDIEGAVMEAKKTGAKNIYLIGHSTGCQKSVYYLSKNKKHKISGVIILAPMSDFADVHTFTDKKVYNRALNLSTKLIAKGKGHELLPLNIWPRLVDAQRFVSLFTPDSVEEIFSYATNREPKLLKKIKEPILAIMAGEDEHKDRPISEITDWFHRNLATKKYDIKVVEKSMHNFSGYSEELGKIIKTWKKNNKKANA